MTSVRSELRARINRGETIVAPGAYDPIGARIVQSLGFPAVYVAGSATGQHLAISEPLVTMTEQVEVARKVAEATDLPVICDANAGFGDPVHTMRTVRSFEDAGIAGIHIEDQVFPKRATYFTGLEHIIPYDDFLQKIEYALKARRDEDFLIIGRTDATKAVEGSRDEAVRRCKAMRDLGVDFIMPSGFRNLDDVVFIRKAVPDARMLLAVGISAISVKQYEDMGIQFLIYAGTPMVAAANAIHEVYTNLKATGLTGWSDEEVQRRRNLINELVGLPEMYKVEAETTEKANLK